MNKDIELSLDRVYANYRWYPQFDACIINKDGKKVKLLKNNEIIIDASTNTQYPFMSDSELSIRDLLSHTLHNTILNLIQVESEYNNRVLREYQRLMIASLHQLKSPSVGNSHTEQLKRLIKPRTATINEILQLTDELNRQWEKFTSKQTYRGNTSENIFDF